MKSRKGGWKSGAGIESELARKLGPQEDRRGGAARGSRSRRRRRQVVAAGRSRLLLAEAPRRRVPRLARISHQGHGLRGAVRPTGQERRAARCGASGKRLDAPCRADSAALRVAPRRPPAASRASTVVPATLFGPLLADRTPGRDAVRDRGEKCGLVVERQYVVLGQAESADGCIAIQATMGPVRLPVTRWPGRSKRPQACGTTAPSQPADASTAFSTISRAAMVGRGEVPMRSSPTMPSSM